MRRARVDQAGVRVRDQRRRLARRRVGQAEEGDVGGVEQARALGRVLAQLGRRRAAPRRRCAARGTRGCEGRSCLPGRRRKRGCSWRCLRGRTSTAYRTQARACAAPREPAGRSRTICRWRRRNRRASASASKRCSARRVVDAVAAPAAADGEPRSARARAAAARPLPAAHAHGRRRALRAGREHQGAGRDAAGAGAPLDGGAGDRFEIIAGERRVRAARLAGLDAVPVLVRDVPDEAAAAMALIENIQREDLNPLEEARGLQRLTEEFGLTHEAAARAVGRSRSATTNLLRLLQPERAGAADAARPATSRWAMRARCCRSTVREQIHRRPTRSSPGS